MAKKTTSTAVPKYTIAKPSGKASVVCKLAIPTIESKDLVSNIEDLLAQAKSEHPEITRCRGTVTLYK